MKISEFNFNFKNMEINFKGNILIKNNYITEFLDKDKSKEKDK